MPRYEDDNKTINMITPYVFSPNKGFGNPVLATFYLELIFKNKNMQYELNIPGNTNSGLICLDKSVTVDG